MVRRDGTEELTHRVASEPTVSRCALPAGASPAPVIAGAPGSRPHPPEGDLGGRAGCQKPVRQRELYSGEPARGPQHDVKPAASTDSQSGSRAAHVTAKAMVDARGPERAATPGGVGGAARVQGGVRNTGGPSARPTSGQGVPYKPRRKRPLGSGSPRGPRYRRPGRAPWERTPCGRTRREGRVPAVVESSEQVSAREWPARPDLTTPAAASRATTCDNGSDDCGRQPSGTREGAFTRCMTMSGGVTSFRRRGSGCGRTRA